MTTKEPPAISTPSTNRPGCLNRCAQIIARIWLATGIVVWCVQPPIPIASLATGGRMIAMKSNQGSIVTISVTSEGPWKASVWDLPTGRLSKTVALSSSTTRSAAYGWYCEISPDSSFVAYGEQGYGGPSVVHVMDLVNGSSKTFDVAEVTPGITPVAISPDSKLMALSNAGPDSLVTVEILKAGSHERVALLTGLRAPITFSADGRTLAAGDVEHRVCLVNAVSGDVITRFAPHTFPVSFLAFSSDGTRLASAANSASSYEDKRPAEIWQYDVAKQEQVRSWNCPGIALGRLWFDETGKWLCAADSMIGGSMIWDVTSQSGAAPFVTLEAPVLSKDGTRQAILSGKPMNLLLTVVWENPMIQILDRTNGKVQAEFKSNWPEMASLRPIAFSPDDRTVAVQVNYRSFLARVLPMTVMNRLGAEPVTNEVWFIDIVTGNCRSRIPGYAPVGFNDGAIYVSKDGTLVTLDPKSMAPNLWRHPPRRLFIGFAIALVSVAPLALMNRKGLRSFVAKPTLQ